MFSRISLLSLALLATSSIAQADCKADIQSIMKSLENAGPYRVEFAIDASGTASKMAADVIMPHSMRMKGDGMEMVMTPNGVWMSQGGALQKMPNEMKDQIQGMIRQGLNLGLEAIDNAECPGTADFEGGSYTLYKYDANATFMGIASKSKVSMYVNGDDRPEWMVVDGEAMGVKSLTKQHITFDDSITIADPQ
jgi:hypothetical protein